MPRILLLMTTRTYRADAFVKAAARVGVEVTVGTEQEQLLASLTPGAALLLDFQDSRGVQREVVEFAQRFPLDAVIGVDDDTVIPAALAAKALGIPHNSVDSVKAARYKDVMRLALAEAEIPTPYFKLLGTDDDPRRVANRLPYPCVVKPLSLSASRGVIRADDAEQFVGAFQEVVQILREANLPSDDPAATQVLVESFIPGKEVALEGLLTHGKLTVLALFDKPDPLDGPYFEETIYVTPSRLPPETQLAIADTAGKGAAALGLREGPIHAELRVNQQGPWIIEIAPRSIGGQCSSALRFDFDLSLEEIILRRAAGLDIPSLQRERQSAGVMMIPIPRAGRLYGVHGRAEAHAVPGIEQITISIPCGHEVVPLPRATRYLGFIFGRSGTPAAVETALREAHTRLKFDIR